jgi:hypothetical protein
LVLLLNFSGTSIDGVFWPSLSFLVNLAYPKKIPFPTLESHPDNNRLDIYIKKKEREMVVIIIKRPFDDL